MKSIRDLMPTAYNNLKSPFVVANFTDVCEKIRQQVRDSGMTQKEVADKTGLDKSLVSVFLSGRRIAHGDIDRIAEAIGSDLRTTTPSYRLLGEPTDPVVEINERFVRCRAAELTYDDARLFATLFTTNGSHRFGPHIEYESEGKWVPLKPGGKVTVVDRLRLRMYPWLLAGESRPMK